MRHLDLFVKLPIIIRGKDRNSGQAKKEVTHLKCRVVKASVGSPILIENSDMAQVRTALEIPEREVVFKLIDGGELVVEPISHEIVLTLKKFEQEYNNSCARAVANIHSTLTEDEDEDEKKYEVDWEPRKSYRVKMQIQ